MNLLTFTLLATCMITGLLSINWRKLINYAVVSALLLSGFVIGSRFLLSFTVTDAFSKDKVIAGMHLLHNPVPTIVHQAAPTVTPRAQSAESDLKEIKERGVLRVGYNPDRMPFTFFNSTGDLVGFDVEMAHRLARELGVTLEFIPLEGETMVQQLEGDQFDIVIGGMPMLTSILEKMSFSDPYLDATAALVVKDHRRKEFAKIEDLKRMQGLKVGIRAAYHAYYLTKMEEKFPRIKLIKLQSNRDFFEQEGDELDALLTSAEAGAAWTLLYPEYEVVVPQPATETVPLGYAMAYGDDQLNAFMNRWIELKKKDGTIERLYNYWILGHGAVKKEPRWSIIRNVLKWAD
jgi:ABC-type amino acid transport substrate-binding protein